MKKDIIIVFALLLICISAKSQQRKYDTVPVKLFIQTPDHYPEKSYHFKGYEVLWHKKIHETYLDSAKHEKQFHPIFKITKE